MKLILSLSLLAIAPALAQLRLEPTKDSMRVLDGETLVSEYRTDSRVPYLYPLLSPSGANVTRHWPMSEEFKEEERDHPHHRSVWLAHGAVNGCDFWAFHDESNARIHHVAFKEQGVDAGGTASFSVDLIWIGNDKEHLKERRTHAFRKVDEKTYVLDVTSRLLAEEADVLFGDTKEGMFGLRVDRTLRLRGPQAKSHILNSEGHEDDDAWGKRAKWVAYHGPDENGEPVVIAMFDHRSNLRHPTWWHARDYGLAAANPFGIHDFEGKKDKTLGNHTLKKGEELVFRYQVVVHHGTMESADIGKHWEAFTSR